jgi:hypothetical protein
MTDIEIEEFEKIPYFEPIGFRSQVFRTLIFYVEGKWRSWIPSGNKLVEIFMIPVEGFYFADETNEHNDIYLHFLDFFCQKATFVGIQNPLRGIEDDFFNLAASLAKLDLLWNAKNNTTLYAGLSRMIGTEIEYIFSVCRSIFDLLQEILSKLWAMVELSDRNIAKKQLKPSFAKMLNGDSIDADYLTKTYGLPKNISDIYIKHKFFFLTLRKFRDGVIHYGSPAPSIYATENGFAVHKDFPVFANLNVWNSSHEQLNDLFLLKPAIEHVIRQTIAACDDFSNSIALVINCPPQITKNLRLYMRSPFNSYLLPCTSSTKTSIV